MRTGLWPAGSADAIETKYDHWPDEKDGRFTTAGSGRHDGSWQGGGFTGGGGGSGGGGGATGSWQGGGFTGGGGGSFNGGGAGATEAPTLPGKSGSAKPSARHAPGPLRPAGTPVAVAARQPTTPPMRIEVRNGYSYRIDSEERTRQVSGAITLGTMAKRSRTVQAAAGGADRLPKDDGGHYIAARFNGPSEAFNHFAQDANFNRGGYRALEDEWAKDTRSGHPVSVTIMPAYAGHSKRPYRIAIIYRVNGDRKTREFENRHQGGGRHG